MFVTIFERQFGDAGFVEFAEAFRDHRSYCSFVARASGRSSPRLRASSSAMPLSLAACAAEKKQVWSRFCMSSPSVCKTRECGAGLREHFAQHREIESERVAKSETLGQAGGVDVHHHVDERFHLRRFARLADVTNWSS